MLKEKIINSCAIIIEVIQRLIRKIPIQYICPAGVNNLAVTQDGIIYPCFMFIGTDLSVGNINISSDEIMTNF
ncbi:SPASM domain-containing protein [Thermoanaerobacter sp. YS13]|uniref:SPASM domain-containing protein n=1 Tax=Thermoanaerobacter sp. YS13 TaxID=1511746 RepID=UPI0005B450E0